MFETNTTTLSSSDVKRSEQVSLLLRAELNYLFKRRKLIEIRAILSTRLKKDTLHGYFNAPEAIVEPALALNEQGYQIYYTLNHIEPNRFGITNGFVGGGATKDGDITRRLRLLVDIDPTRPAGTSATEAERRHASRVGTRLVDQLTRNFGFPTCETAMSGNGYQYLFELDLEVSSETNALIARCLKALDRMFSTKYATVDTTVFNPARICKLLGTMARKGENTTERPHRLAHRIGEYTQHGTVSRESLEALASHADDRHNTHHKEFRVSAPKVSARKIQTAVREVAAELVDAPVHTNGTTPFIPPTLDPTLTPFEKSCEWVEAWMAHFGVEYHYYKDTPLQRLYFVKECVLRFSTDNFSQHEKKTDAAILVHTRDGRIGYRCFHDGCNRVVLNDAMGEGAWKTVRSHIDQAYRERITSNNTLAAIASHAQAHFQANPLPTSMKKLLDTHRNGTAPTAGRQTYEDFYKDLGIDESATPSILDAYVNNNNEPEETSSEVIPSAFDFDPTVMLPCINTPLQETNIMLQQSFAAQSQAVSLRMDSGLALIHSLVDRGISTADVQGLAKAFKDWAQPKKQDDVVQLGWRFPFTDKGNSLRVAECYQHQLRYCPQEDTWYVYEGGRWKSDAKSVRTLDMFQKRLCDWNYEVELFKQLPQSFREQLQPRQLQYMLERMESHANANQSSARIHSAEFLAKTERVFRVTPEEFDANRYILNVQNGTIDLKNGDLLNHRSGDLLTKWSPIEYDLSAQCPNWLGFLHFMTNGNQEYLDYLQRVFGYCLTGGTGEKCFFVLLLYRTLLYVILK